MIGRLVGFVAFFMGTGCSRGAPPPAAAPSAVATGVLAIYEADDLHDLTSGVTTLPANVEIFREREPPKTGYFYASLPSGDRAAALDFLRTWTATLHVPSGDTILFGATTSIGVRTYLVKSVAVLDSGGVLGAMATPLGGDQWGVALTFEPGALQSLTQALSRAHAHFRVVVQGLVETDTFELVDETSRTPLPGPMEP